MRTRIVGLIFLLVFPSWILGSPPAQERAPGGHGAPFSEEQWNSVLAQFEDSVSDLSKWLEKTRFEKQKIQSEIEKLETKINALRKNTSENTNVFDEIRLKRLLNSLKENLEKNSSLQHQWDDKQKDFEQKALSLVSLYNDKIEMELSNAVPTPGARDLDSKVDFLTALIQKRNQIQRLLAEYRKKSDGEKLLSVANFGSLKAHDRENLQLALDLFRDRKKELSEQLEKWALESEQAKNELKLQGKMQEFLEDIRQINEDTDLPRGGLKRRDLEGMVVKGQRGKLETRINELQSKIIHAQKTLVQISELMGKVQHQLDSLNERKRQ